MVKNGQHFIAGRWVTGSGEIFSATNPASGEAVWEGHAAAAQDVVNAIQSARDAFATWANLSLEERIAFVENFGSILENKKNVLALALSMDTGKPLWEAKNEIAAMIGKIPVSIAALKERAGDVNRTKDGRPLIVRHRPHGVVAVFGPFNFPCHLPNGHIVPALLAGNTVILKPSELTPYVSEQMMHLWQQAKLPHGVINLLQGGAETGQLLAAHPDLDGLFFTGSASVGRQLSAMYGKYPDKILALELGGNNPLVVSRISDVEAAAYATVQSAFLTSGQRCSSARRLIVVKSRKSKAFVDAVLDMMKTIKVGPYTDVPEAFMGPVISMKSAEHILQTQEWFVNMGGKPLMETKLLKDTLPFLSPGLMDVSIMSARRDEEIFGPFLQLIPVADFETAIWEANQTNFGLTAGLLSDDKDEYDIFLSQVRSGVINWNSATTGASASAPFGGIGLSGNHRPGAYYAADYCAYPVASTESEKLALPDTLAPGLSVPKKNAKRRAEH